MAAEPDRVTPGEYRQQQNWIGGRLDSPLDARYVPPPEGEVDGLMSDLVAFVNRDDLPGVAQAAVAHAQFETIHPFLDGNGRVVRCLIHVVLRGRGRRTALRATGVRRVGGARLSRPTSNGSPQRRPERGFRRSTGGAIGMCSCAVMS
jgi:fido (protein-threonine AMPylation protein)